MSESTILHIGEPSSFLRNAGALFEQVYPGGSEYLVGGYVYPRHNLEIGARQLSTDHFKKRPICDYSLVIFHNLIDRYKTDFIADMQEVPNIHWISWGGDIYCHPSLSKDMYEPLTAKYIANRPGQVRHHPLTRGLISRVRNLLTNSRFTQMTDSERIGNAISKIQSFSTVLDSERTLVERVYGTKAEYFSFFYGKYGDYIPPARSAIHGKNILVGNSAYPTNNHLDAFALLKDRFGDISGRKVIVPLSYGDKQYANYISKAGFSYFGENFVPLYDYMSLADYLAVLQSCELAFMNHIRQQALGNVLFLLWSGVRLFFNPRSLLFRSLLDSGFHVYPSSDLHSKACELDDLNANLNCMEREYGIDASSGKLRKLLNFYGVVA